MRRTSTDAQYLTDGTVVIDVDGIPVQVDSTTTGRAVMAATDAEAARGAIDAAVDGARTVLLTRPGKGVDTRTSVGVRIPFRMPVGTSKWRVHIRNRNPQTGTVYPGAIAGTAIGLGTAVMNGDTPTSHTVESASPVVHGSWATPTDGSEFVTPWITSRALTAGTWYHLSYGYTTAAGQTSYAASGYGWISASSTTILNKTVFVAETTAPPLDVWIEAIQTGGASTAVVEAGRPASVITYPGLAADRTRIACYGDSLTDGGSNGALWPEADTWPSKLATATGVTVTNLGFTGATVDEMLIMTGIRTPRFVVTGGSIPSSGTVSVTTTEDLGIPSSRAVGVNGMLGGYAGRLNVVAGGTYTWTTYGGATTASVGSTPLQFVASTAVPSWNDIAVIWIGRNDVTNGTTGPDASVPDHVIGGVQRLMEWLTPQVKRVMILGTTTQTNETTGQTRHTQVTEINDRLRALYPGLFKSVQTYLMTQAMDDMGVTPTAEDDANIAAGTLPPSVLDVGDITHINKDAATVVATHLVAPYLRAKGWIS